MNLFRNLLNMVGLNMEDVTNLSEMAGIDLNGKFNPENIAFIQELMNSNFSADMLNERIGEYLQGLNLTDQQDLQNLVENFMASDQFNAGEQMDVFKNIMSNFK